MTRSRRTTIHFRTDGLLRAARRGQFRTVAITLVLTTGCAGRLQVWWPARPASAIEQPDGRLLAYDVDGNGRTDYLQRLQGGYKDLLVFGPAPGERRWTAVQRGAQAPRRPLLVLLLDGVSYERMQALYARGRFRLLRPPSRVISTFPSLTDVAYDQFFGTGPTPGYEAAYYDRSANRLTDGVSHYLAGENERWIGFVDYRMSFLRDAFMYLMPQSTYEAELRAARRVLDRELEAGRRQVVLYLLSTDGLGHMVAPQRLEERLGQLDDWLERAVYDWRGELDLLIVSDHGNSTTPPTRFDARRLLRDAGLRVTSRLSARGDVVVPLFGLLDMLRVHAYDESTRADVLRALSERPEVELLAWRDGEAVMLRTAEGTARIEARGAGAGRSYRATMIDGDPLGLRAADAALRARGAGDADGFASAGAWLAVTDADEYVAVVPRLWDGLFTNSAEQPDVIASLAADSFVGSGFFAALTQMRGTHGGAARRASETFVMSSRAQIPLTLLISEVSEWSRQLHGWPPKPATGETAQSAADRDRRTHEVVSNLSNKAPDRTPGSR